MPVWLALLGTLGLNVVRHIRGKSTLCSSTRPHVSPRWFCFSWGVLTGWLIPHFCRGARRVRLEQ